MSLAPTELAGPDFKRFASAVGEHVLVVPFSQIYDLPGRSGVAWDSEPTQAAAAIAMLREAIDGEVALGETVTPAPQSISLNVSNACNLSCSYCYASRGNFDGLQARSMSLETARAAVDSLLANGDPSAPFTVGFLGGEPFVNRRLVHDVVDYASRCGTERRLDVRFSVTTNGTLLTEDDLELLRSRRFAVTVSIDGEELIHDQQRPDARPGHRSWSTTIAAVRPLLANPGLCQIAARTTVTRLCLDPARSFAALYAVGFRDIGFSPLRSAPSSSGALGASDWPVYLAGLTALATERIRAARRGEPIALSNLAIALKQLDRGAASPYPCGAGGGYFSVASDGTWYACHRAIGDPAYALGTSGGLWTEQREAFLRERHVHRQTDCTQCWARYLCSGGCHQEAKARSPESCNFIRGWLEFCLAAYAELGGELPELARRSRA